MLRWLSLISLLLFGVTFFYCLLWRDYSQGRQLNVVVLTVESLRRDLVTIDNTPHLLSAVEKGGRLQNHLAVSAWTGANIISILSGLSPFTAGVQTRGQSVEASYVLPLEQLVEHGYSAEGIQGFMTMDIYRHLGLSVVEPGVDLLYWLARKQVSGKPFFLWYHYLYTHLPYPTLSNAQEEGIRPSLDDEQREERYNAVTTRPAIYADEFMYKPEDVPVIGAMHAVAVRDFDAWFKEFWEYFNKSGMVHNTILIITADHGDEHGERGLVGHASTTLAGHLHAEIVNLPFFYWLPERLQSGRRLPESPVTSHLDIMPTILGALGIKPVAFLPGRNLFVEHSGGYWAGITSSGGFAEKDPHNIEYYMYGIQQEEWKLLWKKYPSGRENLYLYNTLVDGGETQNLASLQADKVKVLQALIEPLTTSQVTRPVLSSSVAVVRGRDDAENLYWIFPQKDGVFRYDELDGKFRLEWSGVPNQDYVIQYEAGVGNRSLSGELEVQGPAKDYGSIGRRYWDTWIVPYSPYRIRVATAGKDDWSDWITLEAAR